MHHVQQQNSKTAEDDRRFAEYGFIGRVEQLYKNPACVDLPTAKGDRRIGEYDRNVAIDKNHEESERQHRCHQSREQQIDIATGRS